MVNFDLLTTVYNILTHKTTTFITFILLRLVKGGCCISKGIDAMAYCLARYNIKNLESYLKKLKLRVMNILMN